MALPPIAVDESMPILRKTNYPQEYVSWTSCLRADTKIRNILLVGPSGMEKGAFAFHFAKASSENGHKVFYAYGYDPEDIVNKASSVGIELASGKDFKFIDCFSSTLGTSSPPFKETIQVSGPSALNDLSLAINESIKESAGRRWQLSSTLFHHWCFTIKRFCSQIPSGCWWAIENADATVILLIEEGMHEKQLFAMLEHSMDSTFTIHDKGGSFELKIPDVEAMIPMRLSPTGIAII